MMGYPNPPCQRPANLPVDGVDPNWQQNYKPSDLEIKFAQLWVSLYPQYDLYVERPIIRGRRFRFDFVHYPSMVAVEIQGFGPGHYSKKGVDRDNEKHRLAAEQGWLVMPVESEKVEDSTEHNRIAAIISQRMLKLKDQ